MSNRTNEGQNDTTEGVAASLHRRLAPPKRWRRAPKLLASLLAVDVVFVAWVLHPGTDEPRVASVAELATSDFLSLSDRVIHVQGTLVPNSLVAYTNPGECRFRISAAVGTGEEAAEIDVVSEPCVAPPFLRDVDGMQTQVTVVGSLERPAAEPTSTWARLGNALGVDNAPHQHAEPEVFGRHVDAQQIFVNVHSSFKSNQAGTPHPTIRPVPTIER